MLNNEVPYVMFLPAYAATAWYHRKLKVRRPLQGLLREVERFASGEYAAALFQGDALPKRERAQIVQKIGALYRSFTRIHRALEPAHQ